MAGFFCFKICSSWAVHSRASFVKAPRVMSHNSTQDKIREVGEKRRNDLTVPADQCVIFLIILTFLCC